MGALERIKQLQAEGLTEDEAYNQVMQEEHWRQRDLIEAELDYREGFL